MAGLFTAAELADLQGEAEGTLAHSYTRLARSEGAVDAWGEPAATYAATTGVACLYAAIERAAVDARGVVIVETPTLLVMASDPLAPGDRVQAVTDGGGAVLLAGPIEVDAVEPLAGSGATLLKRATLKGGRAV